MGDSISCMRVGRHGLGLLIAAVAAMPLTSQAAAWRVVGEAWGSIEVEEIGYSGRFWVAYDTIVKESEIAAALPDSDNWWVVLFEHGVQAWESINGGPFTPVPMTSEPDAGPTVELSVFDVNCLPSQGGCKFGNGPDEFLLPVGTLNYMSMGRLSWWKDPYSPSWFSFEHEGEHYECWFESGCNYGEIDYDGGIAFEGTVVRVTEPASLALLGLGLAGLGVSRRRKAA